MTAIRIIPTILWRGVSSVRGEKFNNWRNIGPILPSVNIYIARQVDEILLVNLAPRDLNSDIDYTTIKRIFSRCNLPLTYAGGISSLEQVERLLECGVDKIVVNSALYQNLQFGHDIVRAYGSQFLVGAIDYRCHNGALSCFSDNGTVDQSIQLVDHVQRLIDIGVGELLLTSIDRDGTNCGYELSALKLVRSISSVPIIVSGGAGSLQDFEDAAREGADAVAASSVFLFSEITPRKVAQYLKLNGHIVRL